MSDLEAYLIAVFIDKLNEALEGGELNFTPDEISHIVSLAIELSLTGAHRVHGVN